MTSTSAVSHACSSLKQTSTTGNTSSQPVDLDDNKEAVLPDPSISSLSVSLSSMRLVLALVVILGAVDAFVAPTAKRLPRQTRRYASSDGNDLAQEQALTRRVTNHGSKGGESSLQSSGMGRLTASVGLAAALLLSDPTSSQQAQAYEPTDFASETVTSTLQALKESAGNSEETYKVFEQMNDIITEGKGVGGAINYQGIQLERGYVADEDTSIYNPGLTLLTESEKERMVEAVVVSRKIGMEKGDWTPTNQAAFEFLRTKLDPLHVNELRGYLKIVPFYAAAVYLAVLAVQQMLRDFFPAAYIVGVLAICAPILLLVAIGPS